MGVRFCFVVWVLLLGIVFSIFCNTSSRTQISCRRSSPSASSLRNLGTRLVRSAEKIRRSFQRLLTTTENTITYHTALCQD